MGHICILSFCALFGMVVATPLPMTYGRAQYPRVMSMMAPGKPYYYPEYTFKASEAYGAPAMYMGNTAPYNNLTPDEQALLNQALLAYYVNVQNARSDSAENYIFRSNQQHRQTLDKKLPHNHRLEKE